MSCDNLKNIVTIGYKITMTCVFISFIYLL